jgi:transcriptional regulator with XRE-family HTH domain
MSKSDVNQRFIDSVNYLNSIKNGVNKTIIASNIDVSKSKFSEILNGRMNVGIEQIIKLSEVYDISLDYILLGKGEIVKTSNQNLQPVATKQDNEDVVLLKQHIKLLNKQIEELTGDQNKMSVQSMVEFLYDEAKKRSILEDLETLEKMAMEKKKKETNGKK